MRIRSAKLMFVAVVAAVLGLAVPTGATAAGPADVPGHSATPRLSGPATGKVEGFVAAPAGGRSAANAADPPAFECWWGWDTEVGGFYPAAWLKYAATFECGPDFGFGPDMAGTIQGSLHASPGGLLLNQGPDYAFVFCCDLELPPARSEGEYTLTGPGQSFFLNSNSIVDLLPGEEGELWIWTYLPAGCEGVGSPRAVCDIDSTSFTIT